MEIDERIERLGELLFGRGLRLLVPAWILQHGLEPFFQAELIYDFPPRFGTNCVSILNELVELDMLKHLPRGTVPGRSRVIYQMVQDHVLWDCLRIAVAYAREVDLASSSSTPQDRSKSVRRS
jgi:hypothetical protein